MARNQGMSSQLSTILFLMVLTMIISCSPAERNEQGKYMIEIIGSQASLEEITIRTSESEQERSFYYTGKNLSDGEDNFALRIVFSSRLRDLTKRTIKVYSFREETFIDEVSLAPWLCEQTYQNEFMNKNDDNFIERHDLFLGDNGFLYKNTDFNRILSCTCEKNRSADGTGVGMTAGVIDNCGAPNTSSLNLELIIRQASSNELLVHLQPSNYSAIYSQKFQRLTFYFGFLEETGNELSFAASFPLFEEEMNNISLPTLYQFSGNNFFENACDLEFWPAVGEGFSRMSFERGAIQLNELIWKDVSAKDATFVDIELDFIFYSQEQDRHFAIRGTAEMPFVRYPDGN